MNRSSSTTNAQTTEFVPGGIRAVLFDAGNTIIYPRYDLIATALERCGVRISADTLYELDCMVRDELNLQGLAKLREVRRWDAYWRYVLRRAGVSDDITDQILPLVAAYDDAEEFWIKVFPEAEQVLAELRVYGFILGVVSNSNGRIERYLEKGGLREYLSFVVDSSRVGVEKLEPGIFQIALGLAGTKPDETVFVGDAYAVDIVGARRAGLHPVLLREAARFNSAASSTTDDGAFDCLVIQSLTELIPLLIGSSVLAEVGNT